MTNKADRTYNVNIKRLALLTLPTWLLRPLSGALIYAGVSPLGRLLQELRAYRSATSYRLRHNGQVCKLCGALNDEFEKNREHIELARKGKNIPVHYYVKYLNQQGYLFPRTILNAYANGNLSYGEMCRTLNVSGKHIGDIERAVMFT